MFSSEVLNLDVDYTSKQTIFNVFAKNEGVFGVDHKGADVHWFEAGINPVRLSSYVVNNDTYYVSTSLNGSSVISELLGIMEGAAGDITIADYLVVPNTVKFYDLPLDTTITSFGRCA